MLSLYQEFLEKTKTDGWIKLPSFESNREHIQGLKLPTGLAVTPGKAWPEWSQQHRCPSPPESVQPAPFPAFKDSGEGIQKAPIRFSAGSSFS